MGPTPATNGVALATYYRVTWQLLILLSTAIALGSEVVRPLATLPFLVAAVWLMTGYGTRLGFWRRQLTIALSLALAGLAADEVFRIERFEEAVPDMVEVLCGFLPLILLTHERPRSYWLAILTTVVIAVGSISVTASVLVYLGFFAYIAVLLLNLNAANLRGPPRPGKPADPDLPPGYFRQFLQAVPAGALSAAAIFLAFPRVQSFTMSLGSLVAKPHTGYSGLVTLSGEGEIEASQALAFFADALDKDWLRRQGASLLFRGDALDSFDGVHWTSTVFHYVARDRVADTRLSERQGREQNRVTIHMEPTITSAIFYPDVLLGINNLSPAAGHFLFNANGSIVRDVINFERFQYTVRTAAALATSDLPSLNLASLAQADPVSSPHSLDAADLALYTAIPKVVHDAPYFQAFVREMGLDPAHTTLAVAEGRIEQFFTAGFEATLANHFSSSNSLESFLATDHRGHCEYFATATALLLRSLGVPSRVVVGYRGGTFNQLIDMLEVREENAHAWVEAFVPGVGWHALDPTPPAPAGAAAMISDVAAALRLYVNAAGFWFRQYVIDYDQTQQRELLKTLKGIGSHSDQEAWTEALKRWARPLGIGVGAGLLLLFGLRLLRGRRETSDLPLYYRKFLARMARIGHPRVPGETFAAYHDRLRRAGLDAELIAQVGSAIECDLYTRAPASEAERSALLPRIAKVRPPQAA